MKNVKTTSKAQLIEELRKAEVRLELAVEGAKIGMWDWDIHTGEVQFNDIWKAILGYAPDEIEARIEAWKQLVHPDDTAHVQQKLFMDFDGDESFLECEHRLLTKSGRWKWVLARGKVIVRDDAGLPLRCAGTCLDIDKSKLVQIELQAAYNKLEQRVNERTNELKTNIEKLQISKTEVENSNAKLRALINAIPDLVWLKDISGTYLNCNQRFEHFFGAEEKNIVGKTDYDFVENDLADFFRRNDSKAVEAGKPVMNEEEVIFAVDGHKEILETIKTPIFNSNGEVLGILGVGRDITERTLAQETYRILVNTSLHALVIMQKGRIKFANPAVERMSGYSMSEILNMDNPVHMLIHPDDLPLIISREQQRQSGVHIDSVAQYRIIQKCGKVRWVESQSSEVKYQGEPAVYTIYIDITNRKAAEEDLQKSKESYQLIFENSGTSNAIFDTECRLTLQNSKSLQQLKKSSHEVTGKTALEIFGPVRGKEVTERMKRIVSSGIAETFETEFTLLVGKKWFHSIYQPILGKQGKVEAVQIISRDITEMKLIEDALRKSEQRYRTVVEHAYDWQYWRLSDDSFECISPSVERITGYKPEDFNADRSLFYDIVHPKDREDFKKHCHGKEYDGVKELQFRIIHKDGTYRWIHHICQIMKSESGEVIGVRATNRDITENVIQEQYYKTLFESAGDAILILHKLKIENCNQKAVKFFKRQESQMSGVSIVDLSPFRQQNGRESNVVLREKIEYALKGKRQIFTWQFQNAQGEIIPAEVCLSRIHESNTNLLYAMIRDISGRIEMQQKEQLQKEQLQQADKMASLGILVSGMAHEVNNPNNFIMLNAPLLREAWEDAKPVLTSYYEKNSEFELGGMPYLEMADIIPRLFDGIERGAQRIKLIVEDLKNYARQDAYNYNDSVNVNLVIKEATSLLKSLIERSTKMYSLRLPSQPVFVTGNRQKLEQVMINLIQNACYALTSLNNAITVSVETIDNKCIISIKDEGVGIPSSHLSLLTDPFFTTRRSMGGTGLGLSVSAGIVKDHCGELKFESEVGVGTTANVIIPLKHLKDTVK